jgi:hypothetical protein
MADITSNHLLPGETPAEYVARKRRQLHEQAKQMEHLEKMQEFRRDLAQIQVSLDARGSRVNSE